MTKITMKKRRKRAVEYKYETTSKNQIKLLHNHTDLSFFICLYKYTFYVFYKNEFQICSEQEQLIKLIQPQERFTSIKPNVLCI